MIIPPPLLTAILSFADGVSEGTVERVLRALDDGSEVVSGLNSDSRQALQRLNEAWRVHAATMTSKEFSYALAGVAHAISAERARRKVELVWSGPDSPTALRSTEPALLELLNGARNAVYIVAFAAYKVPRIADAIDRALARGVRVVLVLESEESHGGKVRFDPLPFLARGPSRAEVYMWPTDNRPRGPGGQHGTLHAKFAVADRSKMLVSSANLTEHAFNLNIELGVLLTGHGAVGEAIEHVDSLIRTGILRPIPD